MTMDHETFDDVCLFAFATAMEFSKVFPESSVQFATQDSIPENTLIPVKGRFNGSYACILGVGILDFSVGLARVLYDCRQNNLNVSAVVNVGICGAYSNQGLSLLDVVRVESETVGDMGVQERDGSLTHWIKTYRSVSPEMAPNTIREFICNLKSVSGLTVNCCTGTEILALQRSGLLNSQVESMEGAACLAVGERFGVPAFEIRVVSNIASTRDKSQWQISEALQKLHELLM